MTNAQGDPAPRRASAWPPSGPRRPPRPSARDAAPARSARRGRRGRGRPASASRRGRSAADQHRHRAPPCPPGSPRRRATRPAPPPSRCVDVWEDFQCPICRQFETAERRAQIEALATDGKARVVYHTLTFLDRERQQPADTQESLEPGGHRRGLRRRTRASSCRVPRQIFAEPARHEGAGYTDEQLSRSPRPPGVADMDAFSQCLAHAQVRRLRHPGRARRPTAAGHRHADRPASTAPCVDFTARDRAWTDAGQRVLTAVDKAVGDGGHRELATGALPASIPSPSPGRLAPRAVPGPRLRAVHHRRASSLAVWIARPALASPAAARPGTVADIAVWAVPFGIVGGRLYHVITDPAAVLRRRRAPGRRAARSGRAASASGARSRSAALGAWIGCRRAGRAAAAVRRRARPGHRCVAQALGRWGNWFNQELFGRPDRPAVGAARSTRPTGPPGYEQSRPSTRPSCTSRCGASASPCVLRLGRPPVPARATAGCSRSTSLLYTRRPVLDRAAAHRRRPTTSSACG